MEFTFRHRSCYFDDRGQFAFFDIPDELIEQMSLTEFKAYKHHYAEQHAAGSDCWKMLDYIYRQNPNNRQYNLEMEGQTDATA